MREAQLTVPDVNDFIWVCRHLSAALQGNDSVMVALDAIAATPAPPLRGRGKEPAWSRKEAGDSHRTTGPSPGARRFILTMRQALESGGKMGQALLASGLASYAGHLVWAGEVGGTAHLIASLTVLAEQLEMEQQLPAPQDPLLFAYGLAFSRIATMLKMGVPVVQAFESAAESSLSPEVESTLLDARLAMEKGLLIGTVLPTVTEDLPPVVIEMIAEGEVQGRLDDVLAIAADYLFDEAGRKEA